MIFDAPITELGETQAKRARLEVEKFNIKNVIVSPFTRTLQTAQLIFGNNLPFQINAEVREQLVNSCDVGSPPHKLAEDFPHLNFNHLDECWWHEGEKDYRGISVEPENPIALANGISMLVNNKDLRNKLGDSGRNLIEKQYSWAIIVDNWLKEIHS